MKFLPSIDVMLTLLTINVICAFFAYCGVQCILCCVFIFMSSSSCVAYVDSFSGLSIFDWPGNIDPKPEMSHYIPCLIAE